VHLPLGRPEFRPRGIPWAPSARAPVWPGGGGSGAGRVRPDGYRTRSGGARYGVRSGHL